MDVIDIDGKKYDPYFILGVTKDDTGERITKTYREKVKRYHPDKYIDTEKKKKYEKYFKILSESYQYIKKKREQSKGVIRYKKNSKDDKQQTKVMTNDDLKEFNQTFKKEDPNSHGYGDNYDRLTKMEDYDNLEIDICNQFTDKKFSNDDFNDIFEYNKKKDEDYDKVIEKSLIHKTTDGFSGYNSSDFGNCALVSSFNGLMITGDMLGENGVGYWGSDYSDYKYSYKGVKNPNSKVIVSKQNRSIKKVTQKDINDYKSKYNSIGDESDFSKQKKIDDLIYGELVEKEKQDEFLVKKYIAQYDKGTVEKALRGELPKSQTYKDFLQKYISN